MALLDKIKDKQVEVKYESGDHYLMTYLAAKELRWEALGEVAEGKAATGTEPYWSREIAPGIYNVNWIEAGQRGGRGSALLHGSFSLR